MGFLEHLGPPLLSYSPALRLPSYLLLSRSVRAGRTGTPPLARFLFWHSSNILPLHTSGSCVLWIMRDMISTDYFNHSRGPLRGKNRRRSKVWEVLLPNRDRPCIQHLFPLFSPLLFRFLYFCASSANFSYLFTSHRSFTRLTLFLFPSHETGSSCVSFSIHFVFSILGLFPYSVSLSVSAIISFLSFFNKHFFLFDKKKICQ